MTQSLALLLEGVFDYAGLYPPTSLPVSEAVEEYASLLDSPAEFMVGSFIVPATSLAKVEEVGAMEGLFENGEPMPVVVTLVPSGDRSGAEVVAEVTAALRACQWLTAATIEAKLPPGPEGLSWLKPLKRLGQELEIPVMLELGWERNLPAAMEEAIVTWEDFGFKARMGGDHPTDVPPTVMAAQFIWEASALDAPFKFTAGLHNPLRHMDPLFGGEKHGFLNVLAAALAAVAGDATEKEVGKILDYQGAGAFAFGDDAIVVAGTRYSMDDLETLAEVCFGIGSCSIEEPFDGLVRLGLLESATS